MNAKLVFLIWSLTWIHQFGIGADAEKWPDVLDESVDEQNDAELFQAVVDSMKKWELHKRSSRRIKREVSKVCYEDVGCFEDTGPFSYLEMLPSPPKDVGTRFFVYGSRKARSVPMEVSADDIDEKAHNAIDTEIPTKVIVHGFGSGCDHVWVYEMRSALMAVHDCNIVCVDWSPGSAIPNYVRAAANTRLVGRQLAKLIRGLNVPLDKVHMIGFSLGAHVAGFAGAELANVSRITGLDPAGPLFESQDPRARLDETDAQFVDVIHSNGEQLILGGLGSWQAMGDVDFYPNGGRMQTGCSNLFVGAVSDFIWSGSIEGRSLCNHRRAYKLFTDSVSPKCRFPAFPCEKGYDGLLQGDCFPCGVDRPCGDMGYYSDTSNARGQLYLVTREEEPFCAHQYQIKVSNSRGERPARSYGKLQVSLVGAGGFNETFTMTRKDDEELLVGAILHRIVVPHPVVINLEAIEVKYTAYSGWISSGLVSWSIDKVSILDSFGKSLSICRRSLILESGRPINLPLYPGDCNIPAEVDSNSTTSNTTLLSSSPSITKADTTEKAPHTIENKSGGIGPFTRHQNFDRKNSFVEINPPERIRPTKNLGPFTREQNLRISEDERKNNEEENKKVHTSVWSFVDINDTDSNSLENSEIESGRGFSSAGYVRALSTNPLIPIEATPVESISEIQEPVLQMIKKETGRSMRLPEITEPILRPRSTRQNENLDQTEDETSENAPKSSAGNEDDPKGFTVQFLPERLAGILAQAEKYARQTLLPLISQYTPSFVGSARQERQRYFPPLSDIVEETESSKLNQLDTKDGKNSSRTNKQSEIPTPSRGIEQSDWVPIDSSTSKTNSTIENLSVFGTSDNSGGKWMQKIDDERNSRSEDGSEKNDWVPIINKSSMEKFDTNSIREVKPISELSTTLETLSSLKIGSSSTPSCLIEEKEEHKFIPLADFDKRESYSMKSEANEPGDVLTSTEGTNILSHIQKISNSAAKIENEKKEGSPRSMIFPYAYERKNDPRTRYIPLIPEEEMGRRNPFQQRER